jgi:DNA-binding response OmpR family regulator
MRILVADDDADIRELVVFKLESAGFEVTAVEDGRAALDHALGDPPDLVVLDLMMPRLTGLEVCAALRAEPATERVPVILLTAKAQESDVTRGFDAGAVDYMIKPFSPRELLSRVQAVLGRRA